MGLTTTRKDIMGLKRIVGTKQVTRFERGLVRNVLKTKYTTRTYYSGTVETVELVAVLECGHTATMMEASGKKKMKCYDCDIAQQEECNATL